MAEKKVETPNNVVTLDIPEVERASVWVNGDCTKVLKLNLSDMGVITRLQDAYPKLDALVEEVQNLSKDGVSDEEIVATFKSIDKQMKDLVDGIFDYPVSDILCDGGSMYDPINGQLRFEYIIDRLSNLYTNTLKEEWKRTQKKMEVHTAKYTKSTKKRAK